MIEIPELVAYCDESYARTDEKCTDCQNDDCEGRCSRCFHSIHNFGSTRDYDCQNMIFHYVCEYIYAKSSEIARLFENHAELNQLQELRVLSIGCGPTSELFGIKNINPNTPINYKGFDLNPLWNDIHQRIINSVDTDDNLEVDLINGNVFEQYAELNYTPNVLILSYLVSHLPKVGINVIDFYTSLRDIIINTMPVNSYIIINDTNHWRVRNNFDVLLRILNINGTFSATRYQFKGYNYGATHPSDELIVPIPQDIRDKYESWRECGSAAQIVIKKEAV